jgi:polysaccharide export outer membrane protein
MRLSHLTFAARVLARNILGRLRAAQAGGAVGVFVIIGLSACAPPVLAPPPIASAPWPLGPGDHLRIIVFGQNQLGGEFAVDEDGAVSLPLIGRVKMAGLLPADAERIVAQRLSGGLVKNPQVNIDIVHYRPIYVYGEVTKPGAYEFAGNPTVVGAVSLAGGFTYRAQTDGMSIVRYGDQEQRHWSAIDTTPIGPGDVIYVPERWF